MTELEKTLFIPLIVRANESKRKDALFRDERAILISDAEKLDETEYHGGNITAHGIIARTVFIDRLITREIERNEPVTVINIGCGLDTRPYRLNIPNRVAWYDIDLPEVIELRKRYLVENDNHVFIEGSIFDDAWHDRIAMNGNVVILIEGVLMYFTVDEIKKAFNQLFTGFPGARVVFDVVHSVFVGDGITSPFKWGIADISDLDALDLPLEITNHAATGDLAKNRESIRFRILDVSKVMRNRSRILEGNLKRG
jgi:methyltransferase (TIGR00027 family)